MSKKTLRKIGLLLVLAASISSFAYINFADAGFDRASFIGTIELEESLTEEHSIVTPDAAIIQKAISIAKSFLYPAE